MRDINPGCRLRSSGLRLPFRYIFVAMIRQININSGFGPPRQFQRVIATMSLLQAGRFRGEANFDPARD
jgi:hypothetical protein